MGPNVRQIARSIGESEPTVRYWLKEKLIKKGLAIQAVPAIGTIGLRRIVAVVQINKAYERVVPTVFTEMSETSYLNAYAGSVSDDTYILQASIPIGAEREFSRFIIQLEDIGFLSQVDAILPFEWSRVLPMKVDLYDFKRLAWDTDLTNTPKPAELKIRPETTQNFEAADLLILRRMQVDARITAREMADRLGFDYKRVLRHHAHVMSRKLVSGFRLRWQKTGIDPQMGKPRSAIHTYLPVTVAIKGITEEELKQLMVETHRLPFLWSEAGGQNYFCEIPIPLEYANEALLRIKKATSSFEGRRMVSIIAAGGALSFSITPELFEAKSKKWVFDPDKSLKRVRDILLTVKNRGSISR